MRARKDGMKSAHFLTGGLERIADGIARFTLRHLARRLVELDIGRASESPQKVLLREAVSKLERE